MSTRVCLWFRAASILWSRLQIWQASAMPAVLPGHSADNSDAIPGNTILLSCKSARACLKNAFCKMCVTICGIFCPDEDAVAGYGNWIRVKYPAKWGVQIAGMIFQTRSNLYLFFYMVILLPHGYYIRILCQKPFRYWFTWYRYWLFQTYCFPKKNSPSDLLYVNETVLFYYLCSQIKSRHYTF